MWINDFLALYANPLLAHADIAAAMSLKRANLPRSLYRYRAFDEKGYALKTLSEDSVWLTQPDQYNDPYDSCLTVPYQSFFAASLRASSSPTLRALGFKSLDPQIQSCDSSRCIVSPDSPISQVDDEADSEFLDRYREILPGLFDDLSKKFLTPVIDSFLQEQRKKLLICCFSQTNESILMWSHYADNHRGFCVAYDLFALDEDDPRQRMLFPVIYSDQMFDISRFILERIAGKSTSPFHAVLAAIHKSKAWEYEQEWRLLLPAIPDMPRNYPMPTAKAVYLGARITDENRQRLEQIADARGIPVIPLRLASGEFRLVSETTTHPNERSLSASRNSS